MIRISIDAMGGDHGPAVVLPALARVLERRSDRGGDGGSIGGGPGAQDQGVAHVGFLT